MAEVKKQTCMCLVRNTLNEVLTSCLLINVCGELVQTVIIANDEVKAEVAAAATGQGVQREMKQVFAFPIDLP